MNKILPTLLFLCLLSCAERVNNENINKVTRAQNYLSDFSAFTQDSLVNVVIEIPSGTNQKWEVNKETGHIEWEQITPDSFRVVNYLAYPANYGFVPQTYLPPESGGDGDPVDVFVLGASHERESIVKAKIVGIIHMLDNNEMDSKLLAININEPGLNISSYEMLTINYPGVIEIMKIWLSNYKGPGKVKIISVNDEKDAIRYLKIAHTDYNNQKIK